MSRGSAEATQAVDPVNALATFGIPELRPGVDSVVDATERCLARHGVRRTTMSDIAKDMGVSRPTLYKHVRSVEEAMALLAARELRRFLDDLNALLGAAASAEAFIEMAERAVVFASGHAVIQRVLSHEPELVGEIITSGQAATYLSRVVELFEPVVVTAMKTGAIRAGDAQLVTELIVRLCVSVLLSPTGDTAGELLRCALTPVLVPEAPLARRPRLR
jgi:AcrR family transcriptional regulator